MVAKHAVLATWAACAVLSAAWLQPARAARPEAETTASDFPVVAEASEAGTLALPAPEPEPEAIPAPAASRFRPVAAGDKPAGPEGGKKETSKEDAKDGKKDEKKPPEPYEIGSDKKTTTAWADGLQAQSANKDFRVKVGGRTQVDAVAFSAGPGPSGQPNQGGLDPELADTVDFRRARFRVEGRMYEFYDFACEYDFVNQININNEVFPTERDSGPLTAVTDLWMQLRELPLLGTVRVGNQKDPYGYEHLTSSRFLNFMERSFSQDAFEGPFNNGFVPGIQIMNSTEDGRIGWQVGEFKNTTNPFGFSNSSGGSMTVGRIVFLPIIEDEGRKLLHVAVAGRTMEPRRTYTRFDPVTGLPLGDPINAVRFRSRGDIRNGPPGPLNSIYADTGLLQGTWQNMIGLELVGNNGPWSFQSEYFGSWLYNARTTNAGPYVTNGYQPAPGTRVGTVYYQGAYAEVLYFLTGESRTYSQIEYRFDRVVPHNNFYLVRGAGPRGRFALSDGAWQVGLRYNYLCLNDGEVNGGVLNGLTLGLNWFFNPNAKLQFNYDCTYRDFASTPWNKNGTPGTSYEGSGWIHGFGTRLAFDF